MSAVLRTSIALLSRPAKESVEIRFKKDVTISVQGILEIFAKLDQHGWAAPAKLLVIFPDHPVDFDLPVMSTDHLQGRPDADNKNRTMAIVTGDPLNERFVQLHLTHFPIQFTTRSFRAEAEARAWLEAGAPM